MKKLIYHHLGLGDHFLFQALSIRLADNEKVGLFCKPHNEETVRRLYSDNLNFSILLGDDSFAQSFVKFNPQLDSIKIGHDYSYISQFKHSFVQSLYNYWGFNVNMAWKGFVLPEHYYSETFYKKHGAEPDSYIFVHDDPTRGFNIDKDKIHNPEGLPIIWPSPHLTDSIMDFLPLIINAKQVHCIDSSFFCMCNVAGEALVNRWGRSPEFYFHSYSRPTLPFLVPTINKELWNIV